MSNTTRYQIVADGGVWDHQTRTRIPPNRSDVAWVGYQEWLTGGGVPLPADTIGQDDLATARAKRIEEINAYAAGLRNKVIAGRSAGEMASWCLKLMDALARSAGQPSPFAAMLPALGTALGLPSAPASINDTLAQVRGITEAAHIDKVLAQAGQVLVAEVAIDAIRGKHCDSVAALADVRDVVVYDWRAGWPALP